MSVLIFTHQRNKQKRNTCLAVIKIVRSANQLNSVLSPSFFFFAGCLWASPPPSSFSKTSSTSRSQRRCSEVSSSESTPTESWLPSTHWWRASTTLTQWRRCWSRWAGPTLWSTRWTLSTLRWNGSDSNTQFSVSIYTTENELHHEFRHIFVLLDNRFPYFHAFIL